MRLSSTARTPHSENYGAPSAPDIRGNVTISNWILFFGLYKPKKRIQFRFKIVPCSLVEREFFIDNLLVRVHFIIVVIRWTGLAPWEFEFPW